VLEEKTLLYVTNIRAIIVMIIAVVIQATVFQNPETHFSLSFSTC
jgi:hypothetical protein